MGQARHVGHAADRMELLVRLKGLLIRIESAEGATDFAAIAVDAEEVATVARAASINCRAYHQREEATR